MKPEIYKCIFGKEKKIITWAILQPLFEDIKILELPGKIQLSPIVILHLASGIQNSAQGC